MHMHPSSRMHHINIIYTTVAPHCNVTRLFKGHMFGTTKVCMSRKYLQVILNALGNIEVNGKHVPRRLSWTSLEGAIRDENSMTMYDSS